MKKNTFLIINKTKNKDDCNKTKMNFKSLRKQIHSKFTKIKNIFSDEDSVLELKHQNIFFDIFAANNHKNSSYEWEKTRVLYPSMEWIIIGKLRELIFNVTEKNATFFIGMNSLSRPTLVKPDGAVAGCITEFCKRTDVLRSKCIKLFAFHHLLLDYKIIIITRKDMVELENTLTKKIFNKIKKNENKIKLLQEKTDQVPVITHAYHFPNARKSAIYSSPYIEPKDPVGAITYKCSYVKLTSYDLGFFRYQYQCRQIGLQVDCSESEVEGKKQFTFHSRKKFGFWAYPTRSKGSSLRITGYCNYNQTEDCKLQISRLQKENDLKRKQLNKWIDNIRHFRITKREFQYLFEKLLIKSANSEEKSITYKLNYYLKKFNEKINMLERWTKLIYARDSSEEKLNLQVVKNLKKMQSFYINHFQ